MKIVVSLFLACFCLTELVAQSNYQFKVSFEKEKTSVYYREDVELEGSISVHFAPPSLRQNLVFEASKGGKIKGITFQAPDELKIRFAATQAKPFKIQAKWKILLNKESNIPLGELLVPLSSCQVEVTPRLKISQPSSLVVLVNGDFPVMDALGKLCVEQTIGFAYHKKDFFYQRDRSSANFLETIKKRQAEGFQVDVLTLTHGNNEVIASKPNITNKMIRDVLMGSKNLRFVYMIGCVNASLVDDWLAVGAKSALGHIKNNYLPHLFFPFLFRFLGDGEPLHTAGLKAYELSKEAALKIAVFASYGNPDSIQKEVHDSTPFFAGDNINLHGKKFKEETNIAMVMDPRFSEIERKVYTHSAIESKIFDALKIAIPYSNRKALNYIEGINPMLRDLLPVAWKIANEVLCEQTATGELAFSVDLLYPLLASFPQLARIPKEKIATILERVVFRPIGQDHLRITFEIGQGKGYTFKLKSYEKSRTGELYEIKLGPKVVFDFVLKKDEEIAIKEVQGLYFLVNLPSVIPNNISLKGIALNYPNSLLTVFARSTYTLVPMKVQLNLLRGSLEELEVGGVSFKDKLVQTQR